MIKPDVIVLKKELYKILREMLVYASEKNFKKVRELSSKYNDIYHLLIGNRGYNIIPDMQYYEGARGCFLMSEKSYSYVKKGLGYFKKIKKP